MVRNILYCVIYIIIDQILLNIKILLYNIIILLNHYILLIYSYDYNHNYYMIIDFPLL